MRVDNLVLDGRHMLYRTSDAFKDLTTMIGNREIGCGGMYGFLTVANRLHKRYGGKVWVAWEGKRSDNFRLELYPDYKRKPEPTEEQAVIMSDMWEQEVRLKVMLRLIGVRQYEGINCEADDVLAWIAHVCNEKPESVIIYTGDSDLRQLVKGGHIGCGVAVVAPGRKNGDTVYDTTKSVKAKHGVYPNMLADLKALSGDSSDNIPGVRGIGDVTAAKLVNEYGDVKKVILAASGKDYGNWPVAERFKKSITDARENILLFKKLTKLDYDVKTKEIPRARNQETLGKHFAKYRFQSLLAASEMINMMEMGK